MKRFWAMMLAAMLIAGAFAIPSSALTFKVEETFEVGDINDDGMIDMRDSLALRKYCAGIGEANEAAADINCDGSSNAKDLLLIKKCNAGVEKIENYTSNNAVDRFAIAGKDISGFAIVVPEWATSEHNVLYAANRMVQFVRASTGVTLEIFHGEAEGDYEGLINYCEVPEGSELQRKLDIENYIYEVMDGDLNIYGTNRGYMYATYDIIEDHLGYRFLMSDYIYQYSQRCVDLEEGTYVFYEPALDFRIGGVGGSNGTEMKEIRLFARKINGKQVSAYYEDKYGTQTGPHFINAHSYGYYWKMATGEVDVYFDGSNFGAYEAKYNDGFQQDEYKWNPCFTSDLVYGTLFRGLLETMRYMQSWWHEYRDDGTSSMSFSICDNRAVCTCWECRYVSTDAVLDREGTVGMGCGEAGLNIWLANRACRDIKAFYGEYDEDGFWAGRAAGTDETGEISDDDWYSYGYGEAITDAYPYMKIYTILYGHEMPKTVLPEENLIIMFCGTACNNHFIGSDECGTSRNNLGQNATADCEALKAWGQACKDAGAEIWFWYYPVNYNMKIVDTPNVFNIYHDFKYMITECNVTGIYFESATSGNVFESLKGAMAATLMYDFHIDEDGNTVFMSEEEFHEEIKEYLRLYYGPGYEYVYEYLVWMDEAGNASPCFINNFDRPGDMFDYEFCRENYEAMREPLMKALAVTTDATQIDRVERLLICCDFLGLSACYKDYYVNGENVEVYTERYINMYNMIKNKGIRIYSSDVYTLPETVDITVSPMTSFYENGSWNIANKDTWGYEPNSYGWGYGGVI